MAQRPDWIPSVELDSIYTQHLSARRLCSVESSFSKHFLEEMGRVRAPCCDMRGLKRGTWSEAEDQLLVAHILKYGHENWRALPKLAGLSRCGKSCRLRWLNYLNPHLKRGNFSPEEEETVIRMHKDLGNKWSKIASQLPGRTDNEIKNVWHSYLKRRLEPKDSSGSDNETRKPSISSSSPSSSSGNSCISWSRTNAAQEETKEEASNEDQDMDPSEMQENISSSDASLETNQHCNPVLEEVDEEWAVDLENELLLQDENYGRQELATPQPEAEDDPADMYLHMWSSPPKLYN